MRRLLAVPTAVVVASAAMLAVGARAGDAPSSPRPFDRVRVRQAILSRLDAKIDADAARAHLDARVVLDEAMPLPYLGVDADPVADSGAAQGGMKITKVYPATGAEAAGLREGDVLVAVSGRPTTDPVSLGLAIRSHEVGDVLSFVYVRAGATIEATAPLGRRPEEDEDEEEQFAAVLPSGEPAPSPSPFSLALTPAVRDVPLGTLGLEALLGGHGRPPAFRVESEGTHAWLRQTDDDPTGIRFPMAWVTALRAPDVSATVRIRLVGGRQDRAGGLVVRGENAHTYLVARLNAVEGDLRIFRVAGGLRRTLPGARARVDGLGDGWHVLEVVARGPEIRARLDGGEAVVGYDTYVRGGRVGVWTKSDSVTDFEGLEATPLPPQAPSSR